MTPSAQRVVEDEAAGGATTDEDLLSVPAVACLITRSARTVARLVEKGELRACTPVGARYLVFRRCDVEDYLLRRRTTVMSRL